MPKDMTQILLGSVLSGGALAAVGYLVMPYYIQTRKIYAATYGPIPASLKNVHMGLFATGFFTNLALGLTGANEKIPSLLLKA